jgi:outer membrane receptor for ferrienterochelin and colicin
VKLRYYLVVAALLLCFFDPLYSQNVFNCFIIDDSTHEPLQGVSAIVAGTRMGAVSDSSGRLMIRNIVNGPHRIRLSMVGYTEKSIAVQFPAIDTIMNIGMERIEDKMEEVIVSSLRTQSRIENLPTKVEVLGAEEVNEEVGIKPGNIASLLGDIAGIQTQQTSAATGNLEMRIQGLPGRYTQFLKDGSPLFGGYAGSFSVLQIPPLDLKQIEIVKGASSTLYGGGAIAGMINFVSKRPKENVFEKTILLNQSTLKESNLNAYISNRHKKLGYTFFSGINYQRPSDVNHDGYSDVPRLNSYFVHPTLFFYPNDGNTIFVGYNGAFETRKGGDMLVLKNTGNSTNRYFDQNKIYRHTADINWESKTSASALFTLKTTGSWLERKVVTNIFGMQGKQFSWFTEASYLKKWKRNDLVTGINITGEDFSRKEPDSSRLTNYLQHTTGIFIQDDWRINSRLTVESGFRLDHHNSYGSFALPRFSLLYRINHQFTSRIGGGLGYKTPTIFSNDLDDRDYPHLLPLTGITAERSAGTNWDINFHQHIDEWDVTVNQMFFITSIRHPIVDSVGSNGDISFFNAKKNVRSSGFETYVQLQHSELEIYLGYTYTVAKKLYDEQHPYLSLSARNKFASELAYEFSESFRAGIEAAFTGRQYLDNGKRTPAYLFMAAMVRYDLHQVSFVLNCENLLDYRQTRKESIVSGGPENPRFSQLWAPIDGRIINLSVRVTLSKHK